MKIGLTDEQLKYQDEFKEFVEQEIAPFANQFDKEERVPIDVINKVAGKGYLGALLPVDEGGMGLNNITLGLLNEEVGRTCSSVRSLLTVHGMVCLAISRWGTCEQKKRWLLRLATGKTIAAFALSEPVVGSDAKSIETTAELQGTCYVLNGKKKWITYGQIADLFLLFAKCDNKPTAFLIERNTPGLSIQKIPGMLGLKGSLIAEVTLENCTVPSENIVGSIGSGLSHIALSALDYGRYSIAWGCVGIGQGCVDECVRYTRKRKQFGVLLREKQLIQKMITEMVVDVNAARLLCYNAGGLKDKGDPDSIMATWMAKYFASRMSNRVASDGVQIHGANGCCSDYPVERYFRDAKIMEIIEGTTQMHELLIATYSLQGTYSSKK